MLSASIIVSITVLSFSASPPPSSDARQQLELIGQLERSRAGTDRLIRLAGASQSPPVRQRALLALARNGADVDRLGGILASGLASRAREVRTMAAFAIGELRDSRYEALLTEHVRVEPERAVVREVWKALGRIGRERTLKRAETAPEHYRPWAIQAAGLAARRLKRKPWEVSIIEKALRASDPKILAVGLYALSRGSFREGPVEIYRRAVAALAHRDATVRMQASKALSGKRFKEAKLVDIEQALTESSLTEHQKAWMLRGWAGSATDAQWDVLVAKLAAKAFVDLTKPDFHVLAAALQERGPRKDGTLRHLLARTMPLSNRGSDAVRRRAKRLRCLDRFEAACLDSAEGVRVAMKAGAVDQVLRLAGDPKRTSTLRMAALSALAPGWKKGIGKQGARRSKLLTRALQSADGALAAVAAGIVRDQKVTSLAPLVLRAQRKFQDNVEVAADLTKAAFALGDERTREAIIARLITSKESSLRRLAVKLRAQVNPETSAKADVFRALPAPLRGQPKGTPSGAFLGRTEALLHTALGTVRLRLRSDLAPETVGNFVKLARRGYYNGVKFHRVVPGFVVQAGDPRGDGWGGPGYTIACENNPSSYETGVVGMALAGKDTGGSQWFITLTPQPHLLGTYTVFGKVVEGMDVVRRLTRDDPIHRIAIVEMGKTQ